MAGHPKRPSERRAPAGGPYKHGPAKGGNGSPRHEPFPAGNTMHTTHGAGGLERAGQVGAAGGMSRAAVERSEAFIEAFIGHEGCPEWLHWPIFRRSVETWGRLETQADMVYEWLMRLDEPQRYVPQSPNAQKAPIELFMAIDAKAAKARERLGLDPASHTRIRKDLGLARKAEADALDRLGEQGAKITRAREAKVIQMPAIESGEGA